jgi:hypothetical protein
VSALRQDFGDLPQLPLDDNESGGSDGFVIRYFSEIVQMRVSRAPIPEEIGLSLAA